MASHSSILPWRIPWMEEPGGLQSTGSQRVRHDWATSLSNETYWLHGFIEDCIFKETIQPFFFLSLRIKLWLQLFQKFQFCVKKYSFIKKDKISLSFFLILIFTLFYFTILYWFCHTLTWIHHGCTCVPHSETPPTSLPIPSLSVVSVHWLWVPCFMHWTWTGHVFHIG